MLAGDRAAESDRQVHDFPEREIGSFGLVGIVGVVHDQRVRVAVAGVRDDGDQHPSVGGDRLDAIDEIWQFVQRNPDILE